MKKVVIVGAGVLGAATSYEFAKKGIETTIVEADNLGRATSAAAGIICPWVTQRRNKAWYELARKGAAHLEQLISDLKNDGETKTGYQKVGAIRLHNSKEKLEQLKEIAIKRREEAPQIGNIALLDREETVAKFPLLNGNYHSLFIEGAARVDGRALRNALISAAKKHGAMHERGKAELLYERGAVKGVQTEKNRFEADLTIAANGVWMPDLLAPLQIDLDIRAQKGEIVHLKADALDTASLPVVMPPSNQYLLNFPNGKIVIGATRSNVETFDMNITAGGIHYILDHALKMAPPLRDFSIAETRVGFRPFTSNHLPIFGRIGDMEGLLIANGLGASGLTTGPIIGQQLAKMALGEELDVKAEHYRPEQALRK